MTIRVAYGPKLKVALSFSGKGRTKQAFKAECDINNIMARFRKTGVLDFAQRMEARYGDCTGHDFATAMNMVAEAKSLFQAMPAHLRDHFKNDPARFLEFVNNPANRDEARELGLLKPEQPPAPKPEPMAVRIVTDADGVISPQGGKGGATPPATT